MTKTPPHPLERTAARQLVLVGMLTCLFGVFVAMAYSDRGAPWALGALLGAALAVFAVVACMASFGAIRRTIWRKTRGYPFETDDWVEVTRGPDSGLRGRVTTHDQAAGYFLVDIKVEDDETNLVWISAARLKKCRDMRAFTDSRSKK